MARFGRWLRDDQVVVVVFGTHAFIAACTLGWEVFVTGNGRFVWPHAWPFVFAAAFVATVAYHADRCSRFWWKWSGALLIGAHLSRALAVLETELDTGFTARLNLGAATWGMAAAAVWALWLKIVLPCQTE